MFTLEDILFYGDKKFMISLFPFMTNQIKRHFNCTAQLLFRFLIYCYCHFLFISFYSFFFLVFQFYFTVLYFIKFILFIFFCVFLF